MSSKTRSTSNKVPKIDPKEVSTQADKVKSGVSKAPAISKSPAPEKKAEPKLRGAKKQEASKSKKGKKVDLEDEEEFESDGEPKDDDDADFHGLDDEKEDEKMEDLDDEDDEEEFDQKKKSSRVKTSGSRKPAKKQKLRGEDMDLENLKSKKLDYTVDPNFATNIQSDKYDPKKHSPFKEGEPAPFFFICDCFDLLGTITGQNSIEKKKRVVTNLFKTLQVLRPSEVPDFYHFLTGRLDAEYIQDDIGVGKEILLKAVAAAVGCDKAVVKNDLEKLGDLGEVLETRKASKEGAKKTVLSDTKRHSFEHIFQHIKKVSTTGSTKDKEELLKRLFLEAEGREGKYIIRFIQGGNFKVGSSKTYTLAALARCFNELSPEAMQKKHTSEQWEKAVKRVAHHYPNYRFIIQEMQACGGDPTLLFDKCKLTPGVPCKPMLAKPTKDIRVIFTRFDGKPFTCEYKYDGLRGQIHYSDGKIHIFSRNLEDMTQTYPDVVKAILQAVKPEIKEFVIDTEIVGMDHKTNKILPFQVLMKRSKKNVDINKIENNVCVFLFDCLTVDGHNLLDSTFRTRRDYLHKTFNTTPGRVEFVVAKNVDDFDAIQEFLNESVKGRFFMTKTAVKV